MELLQLRYLCTAARTENFTRAAKYHNIPQSAISKTISQLEKELGVQLFVRSGNRVILSEAGRRFCREVQRALDLLGDAAKKVRGEGEGLAGEVYLLAEEHFDALLRLLTDFRTENPGVTFHVHRTPLPGVTYDLGVSAAEAVPGLSPLFEVLSAEVLLLTSDSHRLTEWDRVPLSALGGERLVALDGASPAQEVARRCLSDAGVALPVSVVCGDVSCLLAYVAAGEGIAFLSGISHRTAECAGVRLCRLAAEGIGYPARFFARPSLSPAAAAFSAAVSARLQKQP